MGQIMRKSLKNFVQKIEIKRNARAKLGVTYSVFNGEELLESSIKSIMSLLTPALKKSNIEVVYNMSPAMENVRVFGFVNDLKQVIMNIIVNGKEAILTRKENEPDIKGQIFINIECVDNNERVIIAIMDNGTGLTEETISKIFEMHYTTKGANGTGIGMYMAQMIIEKMNGTLKVSNRKDVDKGAIIEINMPVYKES